MRATEAVDRAPVVFGRADRLSRCVRRDVAPVRARGREGRTGAHHDRKRGGRRAVRHRHGAHADGTVDRATARTYRYARRSRVMGGRRFVRRGHGARAAGAVDRARQSRAWARRSGIRATSPRRARRRRRRSRARREHTHLTVPVAIFCSDAVVGNSRDVTARAWRSRSWCAGVVRATSQQRARAWWSLAKRR